MLYNLTIKETRCRVENAYRFDCFPNMYVQLNYSKEDVV